MSEFDEETEYLDAIYNVSKGSAKKNSVGPYTKTDVAAQLGAATGIGGGAALAFKANDQLSGNKLKLKSLPKRYEAIYRPTSDPNDTFNSKNKALATKKNVELKRLKRGLRTDIRVNSNFRRAGIGLAGLGAAGMLASDASAYKRNKGKNMKVSKGSTKNNSVGPYTKTDVAAQLGAATGIGVGANIASTANRKIKQQKAYKAYYDGLKNPVPGVTGVKQALSRNIRAQGKLKAVGLGVAGLGAAGIAASDASAYKRNKVSKSAYNMLPKGFSAARKAKALEMAPTKFSAKKQAAYDRMGLSTTQGDIADIAGAGVVGAGIGASLPPMYRKRDKMAAARKAKKVSKAFTLTGEKGDTRNSKYAAGAYLGAAGGAQAGLRLATRKPVKSLKAITRGAGAGAVAGTAIGLGAVGAARKMNRNKMAPVAKSAFGVEHTVAKASGADLARMITSSIPGSRAIPVGGKAASGGRMFPANARLDRVNLNKNPKTSKSSLKAGQNMGRGIASGMSRGYFGPKGV